MPLEQRFACSVARSKESSGGEGWLPAGECEIVECLQPAIELFLQFVELIHDVAEPAVFAREAQACTLGVCGGQTSTIGKNTQLPHPFSCRMWFLGVENGARKGRTSVWWQLQRYEGLHHSERGV